MRRGNSTLTLRVLYGIFLTLLLCACQVLEDPAFEPFRTAGPNLVICPAPKGLAEEIAEVRSLVPAEFNLTCAGPFVVAGDLPSQNLSQILNRVILPVSRAYRTQFMETCPTQFCRVYLYSSTKIYEEQVALLIGHRPVSRLGLYSPVNRSIFINVGSDYGWLCHETWHALVDYDFPGIPPWLDEGMASLFEAPLLVNDRIKGKHNWRLWTLREYFAAGKYIPLRELMSLGRREFYAKEMRGLRYAEARYVCFYLQEKGALEAFYRGFRAGVKTDRAGVKALCEAVSVKSLEEFEQAWLAWLKTLPNSAED